MFEKFCQFQLQNPNGSSPTLFHIFSFNPKPTQSALSFNIQVCQNGKFANLWDNAKRNDFHWWGRENDPQLPSTHQSDLIVQLLGSQLYCLARAHSTANGRSALKACCRLPVQQQTANTGRPESGWRQADASIRHWTKQWRVFQSSYNVKIMQMWG